MPSTLTPVQTPSPPLVPPPDELRTRLARALREVKTLRALLRVSERVHSLPPLPGEVANAGR